ncbi:hypothetical protein AB9T88_12200, partial [Flavobacterium sp. LBUM151]
MSFGNNFVPIIKDKNNNSISVIGSLKRNDTIVSSNTKDADFACSLTLTTANRTQSICINTPITPIIYTTTDISSVTFSRLPPGVTGKFSGNTVTISGTPTTAGSYDYLVGAGCTSDLGMIQVYPLSSGTVVLTSGAGTNTQTKCMNTAITPITYTVTGISSYPQVSGLPTGVT